MHEIIKKFKGKKLLVIGDLILDQYIQGSVSRISQEAPVPVVLQQNSGTYTLGGSANVANNLTSLGAQVTVVGQIGNDTEGKVLLRELKKKKVDTKGVVVNKNIPTCFKTRIIAQHQQVLRIDRERISFEAKDQVTSKIIAFIEKNIKKFDAVIISDYGKGVITSQLVSKVGALARKNNRIITVDPKEDHFEYYKYVTAITPNKKETQNALRNIALRSRTFKVSTDKLTTEKDYTHAGLKLLDHLKTESLLLTLGEEGMRLFEKKKRKPIVIKTRAREVFDVSGAGDTVISVFTLSLAAGAGKEQAAQLANIAAGVVVGKMGAVAVTPKELIQALVET